MSLIHEALKRVESEKSLYEAGPVLPDLAAGAESPQPGRRPAAAAITVAACAVLAGAVIMTLLWHARQLPAPAAAKTEPTPAYTPAAAKAPTVAKDDKPVRVVPCELIDDAAVESVSSSECQAKTASSPAGTSPQGPVVASAGQPAPTAELPTFKVSGVMSGPTGQVALINGQMVQVGGMINGARLVGILGSSVELAIGERRVTVPVLNN